MKHKQAKPSATLKTAVPGEWLLYFIAIVGALISLLLWYASILQSNANLQRTLRLQTEHVVNDVKIQFQLRIAALNHMGRHLNEGEEPSLLNWQTNIVAFINDYGAFEAIAFTGADLKERWVYPNNIVNQQLYAGFIKDYGDKITNLNTLHPVLISNGIALSGSDMGIFVIVPLSTADSKGYLMSLVNVEKSLNIEVNSDDYIIDIYDDANHIYHKPSDIKASSVTPGVAIIDLYGARWKVVVQPTEHLVSLLQSGLPTVAFILGICIAILFAIATRLAQLARQRARSLDKTNKELKHEIAERRVVEASKSKMEKALLQGQKLQAIGTLAGGIAHDFNNLLYAIIGYVEMSREDLPTDSLIHNNLGKVLEASQRGQELISRILAFSRRQHLAFTPLLIKPTIESALAFLGPTIPASVHIDFIVDISDNFTILGDQTRLHQIVVNLVNNGVDALDSEGTLTIKLSVVLAGDEVLKQFPDVRPVNYCRIDVSDSGQGMDTATLERIFEPFFTTKEVGKGTGLGLATVHTIVKEHQGEILVRSELGEGTTFTIFLPEYQS
jgi:signal transduction histidine kinase